MKPAIALDRERITAYCRRWRLRELSLFGSVLRNDLRPDSDVDVLIDLPPSHGLSLYDFVDMQAELEGILHRPVDLATKSGLRNPYRRRTILDNRFVVYAE